MAVDFTGKTVALDFDGVLHSYTSGWTGWVPADPPEPGALEFVRWLLRHGADVVVVSSRAKTFRGARAVRRWLRAHGFPPLRVTHRKVIAVAYVDDRAVPYRPGDWSHCRDQIELLTERDGGPAGSVPPPPPSPHVVN
jgi:hypothetical protein